MSLPALGRTTRSGGRDGRGLPGEAALSGCLRDLAFDPRTLEGGANLLVMPSRDAAHISYPRLKVIGGGVPVGPVLLGPAHPANIVTPTVSVRGLANMTAYTALQGQGER